KALAKLIAGIPDDELPATLANLGGHDLEELFDVLAQADADPHRPTIIFAYTIKGWGLPIAGHPLNHSMLLTSEQVEALGQSLGILADDPWPAFDPESPEGRLCRAAAERLYGEAREVRAVGRNDGASARLLAAIPADLEVPSAGTTSTQETFGRVLTRLADVPG